MRCVVGEFYFKTWLFWVMLCWQDDGGWTPIIWASEHRIVPAVKFLIKYGADPNMKDKVSDTVSHGYQIGIIIKTFCHKIKISNSVQKKDKDKTAFHAFEIPSLYQFVGKSYFQHVIKYLLL